jgi:hypothetical protein
MDDSNLNRRDFHKLSMTALGGMVAGAAALTEAAFAEDKASVNPLLQEPHVCRGLNTCKGKGKNGKNACAGQGVCATANKHGCHGANDCRGQGGCGAHPGENACKGRGACAVPLREDTWKKARARFEELMQQAGKKVGPAPAK